MALGDRLPTVRAPDLDLEPLNPLADLDCLLELDQIKTHRSWKIERELHLVAPVPRLPPGIRCAIQHVINWVSRNAHVFTRLDHGSGNEIVSESGFAPCCPFPESLDIGFRDEPTGIR